jgi:hypothetical protein
VIGQWNIFHLRDLFRSGFLFAYWVGHCTGQEKTLSLDARSCEHQIYKYGCANILNGAPANTKFGGAKRALARYTHACAALA